MNENINLCEILKGHEGEEFYFYGQGECILTDAKSDRFSGLPIVVKVKHDISGSHNKGDLIFLKTNGSNLGKDIMLFPSENQRDWNKWVEEQNPKVPKTWSDLERLDEITECGAEIVQTFNNRWWDSTKGNTPIEKSVLALLKIHQLIEVGYGGNVTNEEWEEAFELKYVISCTADKSLPIHATNCIHTIAFHTKEQAEEFLKYTENVELVKDYFMI